MIRIGTLLLTVAIIWGCASDSEDLCASKECGEMCNEAGAPDRYCDPEGLCRDFSADSEDSYCPSECVPCGASCQPPCPLGALCGYAGPGFCDPEGVCVTVSEPMTGEAERPFDCPGETD